MSPDTRKPPDNPYLEDLPRCTNCGQEFSNHIEVEKAEGNNSPYAYPYPYQQQPHYGYPAGPDFCPDPDMCSPEEVTCGRGIGITIFPTKYYTR